MAYKYLVIDETTGATKRGPTVSGMGPLFVDQKYVVLAPEGLIELPVTTAFTETNLIDVFVNGRLYDEAADGDYLRSVEDQSINFIYAIPKNAKIVIRVYS